MMSNNTVYKKLGTIILNNLRFFIDLKKKNSFVINSKPKSRPLSPKAQKICFLT